jgi:HAD superfamily hydrolase (TIGR01509 family)
MRSVGSALDVPALGPFRALSLDLWFTTFFHTAEDARGWDAARARVLRRWLARPPGPALTDEEIAAASREVLTDLRASGHAAVTTDPEVVVRAIAARLAAEVVGADGAAGTALSSAGLREHPPRTNPDASELVRALDRQGIPVALVTNSARRAESWASYLREGSDLPFRVVVSSADLGVAKPDPTIFREAARQLAVPPAELLHVGDRWELDVVGAQAAGCGAVLYRGLWGTYPAGLYGDLPSPPADLGAIRVVDRLVDLLEPELWRPPASRGR